MEAQDGNSHPQPKCSMRRQQAEILWGKSNKSSGKKQPRDVLYYTQTLTGACSFPLPDAQASLCDPDFADQEGPEVLDDTIPLETSPIPTPDIINMSTDESAQPTLSEILQAVHKCTASVGDLKEQFGCFKKNSVPMFAVVSYGSVGERDFTFFS